MRPYPILTFALASLVGCEGKLIGPREPSAPTPKAPWQRPALPVLTENGTDTGLRRLTRFEVERTVQQVFGVSGATSSLPRHAAFDGFFSNNMHGQKISLGEVEELLVVAERIAVAVVPNLPMPAGCDRAALTAACQSTLWGDLGRLAWRRPVTATELQRLSESYAASRASGLTADESLEAVVMALVMSPSFLYRTETTFTQYEVASRLSYAVWASAPDAELLDAARDGLLATPEGRQAQLERLLAARTRPLTAPTEVVAEAAIAQFVAEWLGASRVDLASKDPSWLAGTNPTLQAELATEFERMVSSIVLAPEGRFEDLLGGDFTFVNQSLAQHYGLPAPSGTEFVRVPLDGVERRGVLTQGLTVAAHTKESGEFSVIQLGKFVREHLLCQTIPPPPITVDTNFPEGNYPEEWTHRQKFTQHTQGNSGCAGCHAQLNPPGFAFYRLDPLGRARLNDRLGRAFDTSGTLENLDGQPAPFTTVGDMVGQISKSQTARACFVRSFMAYALGRRVSESDAALDLQLNEAFEASDGNVRALLSAWVKSDAFVTAGPRKLERP